MHENFVISSQNTGDSECFVEAKYDGYVGARWDGCESHNPPW